ncbi:hypothetical protein KPL71_006735 [Citrus sinensis]|uniref:Uncharacterized protein n=1 Tax=Citrus sinensis TaxID=2711 RepID=A0ACB8LT36_CITSI|nr:hypothetical protein KPL71_006735 [Citrus sinensis]
MEAELRTLINGDWELCYMIRYRFVKVLLEIEFQFNGKGNSYPLSGENAWIDKSKGKFFLATERSDYDGSIFGLHQQIDVNVGIHLKHAEVSFAYHFDCRYLIKVMLDLTKCIVEFKQLPSQYISTDAQAVSIAMAHIPAAAYWTFRSIVACYSQTLSLTGLRDAYTASTTEAWELSSLAHKVSSILEHFKKLIAICYQQIDDNRQIEAYHNLVRLLETIHLDNMKVLRALLYPKDDIQPVVDGFTKNRVCCQIPFHAFFWLETPSNARLLFMRTGRLLGMTGINKNLSSYKQ